MEPKAFPTHRDAALALLHNAKGLNRKAGGFLGQLAVDASPLSPKQTDWLTHLLERAELPPMADGGAQ